MQNQKIAHEYGFFLTQEKGRVKDLLYLRKLGQDETLSL